VRNGAESNLVLNWTCFKFFVKFIEIKGLNNPQNQFWELENQTTLVKTTIVQPHKKKKTSIVWILW
jgi:hypothetical protein